MGNKLIFVTSATGRILPRVLRLGYRVRVLGCDPARLPGQERVDMVDVVPSMLDLAAKMCP